MRKRESYSVPILNASTSLQSSIRYRRLTSSAPRRESDHSSIQLWRNNSRPKLFPTEDGAADFSIQSRRVRWMNFSVVSWLSAQSASVPVSSRKSCFHSSHTPLKFIHLPLRH